MQVRSELSKIHSGLDDGTYKMTANPWPRETQPTPRAVELPLTEEIKALRSNPEAMARVREHDGEIWPSGHTLGSRGSAPGRGTRRTSTN